MKKHLPLLVASFALLASACTSMKPNARTNYVAPSTSEVRTNVTSAQERATSIGTRSNRLTEINAAAALKAKTAKERIAVIKKAVEPQPAVHGVAELLEQDIDGISAGLEAARVENGALREDVAGLQGNLTTAQTSITMLQNRVNDQTILLNTANTERNAAITQGAIDKKNARTFKAILIGIGTFAALAIMFGLFGMKMFVPPLLWATIAAPSAVGIALFFWLGSG